MVIIQGHIVRNGETEEDEKEEQIYLLVHNVHGTIFTFTYHLTRGLLGHLR